jgi:two-component system, NtrC family, sensor histidine kinase HydH
VNRLNGVVTAFLDYARPLKQSSVPTDLNEVVTRTMRLIQNDVPKDISLNVELAPALQKVEADAEQLKQVLINLVQNGFQAIGQAPGRIEVKTVRPDRFSEFRSSTEYVEVHVTDNGPGIPADQQTNIFVPFYTTKQKGTGLGLAICQRIVKNHGGTVAVQSKVGEGSTFVIRLPAIPEAPAEVSSDGTPSPETALAQRPAEGTSKKSRRRRRRAGAA